MKVLDILFVYLKHFIILETKKMPVESEIKDLFKNEGFRCELFFFC
jgi:hypothetical protein